MVQRSWVGKVELPFNRGTFVERILSTVGLGPGYAWCAAAQYSASLNAGIDPRLLPGKRQAAAVSEWVRWAKRTGRLRKTPKRGDLFFWLLTTKPGSPGHIGSVAEVFGKGDEAILRTFEGNTSQGEGGSQREGDGFYERRRSLRALKGYSQWGFISLEDLP
jgi:hypothetical protein